MRCSAPRITPRALVTELTYPAITLKPWGSGISTKKRVLTDCVRDKVVGLEEAESNFIPVESVPSWHVEYWHFTWNKNVSYKKSLWVPEDNPDEED